MLRDRTLMCKMYGMPSVLLACILWHAVSIITANVTKLQFPHEMKWLFMHDMVSWDQKKQNGLHSVKHVTKCLFVYEVMLPDDCSELSCLNC